MRSVPVSLVPPSGRGVGNLLCHGRPARADRVADQLRAATGASVRLDPVPAADPAGRRAHRRGLSRDEAVAVALWNNAAFQVSLSQLGFARADLVDAGIISNPVLSLLFPVGPKQLEATLRWPIEVLWERPRRVAAPGSRSPAAAQGLVQSGLDLVLVGPPGLRRSGAGARSSAPRGEAAAALQRIDTLTQSRLAAGDIAELDARAARVDAARSAHDAERAVHDVTSRASACGCCWDWLPTTARSRRSRIRSPPIVVGPTAELLKRALVARPDLRAAELAVEAAAARIGWEKAAS